VAQLNKLEGLRSFAGRDPIRMRRRLRVPPLTACVNSAHKRIARSGGPVRCHHHQSILSLTPVPRLQAGPVKQDEPLAGCLSWVRPISSQLADAP
jgi:hypothetical protein